MSIPVAAADSGDGAVETSAMATIQTAEHLARANRIMGGLPELATALDDPYAIVGTHKDSILR
jgi:hypothetical protein